MTTEELTSNLEDLLIQLPAIRPRPEYGRKYAMAFVYSADIITMESILSLAKQDRNHDVATLARAVFEGAVTTGLLHTLPDEADPAGRYERFQAVEADRAIQDCMEVMPLVGKRVWGEHLQDIRSMADAYRKDFGGDGEHWSGVGGTTAKRCKYVDDRVPCFDGKPVLQHLCCQFYRVTSSIAHRGSHGISHSVRPIRLKDEPDILCFESNPDLLPAKLAFAIGSFSAELLIMHERFNEPLMAKPGKQYLLDLG
jgi:hypothetical protein